MDKDLIIQKTAQYAKETLFGDASGHDWWHVYRVWKSAINIAKGEKADLFIVEITALLHDIADYKLHDGDDSIGPRKAREWLESLSVDADAIDHVASIIANMSFKGAGVESKLETLEGRIVQDADRLDAIGAIGIARTFAYGGSKGREMYDPEVKPEMHTSFDKYKNNSSPTINHFYEKLLLLKDLMNTETAKQIAKDRHEFMEGYLDEFYKEWEGNK
ncbi:MAG: Metal dependent phosphohydrolase [Candidatus Uhrbacteria bacterium GW2011_GWD2_41_121]|uniref:Metal dependent phosphohydrolase n=1 Tax=Candidatus Uhrbacteria bacterium GW2011_GWC1_41_20 TaxID=1618983 RepID=A0A0G0VJ70_9BACT|nr:MAG: Metal dependent phosphohydrolase [Candidatus Uhrbacteria bacterium GW2011_GWE1_39_46]KKR64212.1 MAG: Metal dependent phosphohydrolase [Candidatus Uhrbacteria bacterium GW2011_GWC2_40_450]KKR90345.1 MAG: Metal dependent phosphohydrolase [Candidatus Uhrbacteria bacterium GW2011_GWD2_41_121]KKR96248.1 MAG: Metal dependent phosphohydrolase [Candidatus Uhrbacteria bacterium GW2011_GWD1_41_16]KKR99621.1 MAG: Metal dependent phosphohydrolase [Candidatus Uhrbacteria bacterium GW2011_GWC1_41_20]